jgi:DNA-binding MurR/RpiR family transcriptional regulator
MTSNDSAVWDGSTGPTTGEGPPDFGALRRAILTRAPAMPKRLTQIARFALEQPQEIAFGTVAEIARLSGVQPSALVRFAQHLGYAGFSDLQAVFRNHARSHWPDYRQRLAAVEAQGGETPADLLAGFARASMASAEGAISATDRAALERAVALLAGARTIQLIGMRRSAPVVAHLAYLLRKLELRCEVIDDAAGLASSQVALLGPDDALLSISFSPYTPTTLELTAAAHRLGVPIVCLTDTPFSPLVQLSNVWLEVGDADHLGFRSLAGTLVLATTLAVAVARRRDEGGAAGSGHAARGHAP